jgi:DNA-binding transcriptional ArsR family regulator
MNYSDCPGQRRLACIAVPSRYSIAMQLLDGPRCVTELARAVGLSQSCTTRHLQALSSAGLVSRVRAGKRVNFWLRVEDPVAADLLRAVLGATDSLVAPEDDSTPPSRRARVAPRRRVRPRDPVESSGPGGSDPEPPEAPRPAQPDPGELEDYLL